MFRFTQGPSTGSQSQCLAKITGMDSLCLSICAWQRTYRQAQWNHTRNFS